jgi:hypothetical protein
MPACHCIIDCGQSAVATVATAAAAACRCDGHVHGDFATCTASGLIFISAQASSACYSVQHPDVYCGGVGSRVQGQRICCRLSGGYRASGLAAAMSLLLNKWIVMTACETGGSSSTHVLVVLACALHEVPNSCV